MPLFWVWKKTTFVWPSNSPFHAKLLFFLTPPPTLVMQNHFCLTPPSPLIIKKYFFFNNKHSPSAHDIICEHLLIHCKLLFTQHAHSVKIDNICLFNRLKCSVGGWGKKVDYLPCVHIVCPDLIFVDTLWNRLVWIRSSDKKQF